MFLLLLFLRESKTIFKFTIIYPYMHMSCRERAEIYSQLVSKLLYFFMCTVTLFIDDKVLMLKFKYIFVSLQNFFRMLEFTCLSLKLKTC